jgi:asparagine synthase (glutamine-hydrolysing)
MRLAHRGPDGHHVRTLLNNRCLLGHNRLAIIDLEGGAQPLANEDSTVWVICNGEIYNYVELREVLIAAGHSFRTLSDCEVLVHLYEEKGEDMLSDLEGMFAFALLDSESGQLFLARDRFGEKPLYWSSLPDGKFAFASEMKALVDLPGVDRSLDGAALAQFLAQRMIPAPRTHMKGIRKLPAGGVLHVGARGVAQRRFWQPEFPQNSVPQQVSFSDAVEQVRERVRQAVCLRLRSDVPVGAFLSGGIDSTAIACSVRELLPSGSFTTFCASFDDKQLDEAPFARAVAQHLGSEHHEVHFSSDDLLSLFESLIDHYDEPFADVSMFPTFAVCRAARLECKVMLSGDGGDECFAGYRHAFSYWRWHGVRRAWGTNHFAEAALNLLPENTRGRGLLDFLRNDDWNLLDRRYEKAAIVGWFSADWREEAEYGLAELETQERRHARLAYPLSTMEADYESYLPEQVLVKVDRASMYSALECRAPLLDSGLFEFVRRLPLKYHFAHGQGKALLRYALPPWVSDDIRWREKQGFTPPLASWLRGKLRSRVEAAIAEYPQVLQPILNPAPARKLLREHLAGADRSDQLFRWIVLVRRCSMLS